MSSSQYGINTLKITGTRGRIRKNRTLPRIRKTLTQEDTALSIDSVAFNQQPRNRVSPLSMADLEYPAEGAFLPSSRKAQSEPNFKDNFVSATYPFK